MLMKTSSRLSMILLLALGLGLGSKDAAASKLPELLAQIEKVYTREATLKTEFTQTDFVSSTQVTKRSSGSIFFKRPNRVRWETHSPDRNLLVSNGKKFWFYTPPFDETEKGQVIERKSAEVQSQLAQTLLSGNLSGTRGMRIKSLDANRFKLTPPKKTAGTIADIELTVSSQTLRITQLILNHRGGNKTTIDLNQIEFGVPMGDEFFEFTPPPNTDRIDP